MITFFKELPLLFFLSLHIFEYIYYVFVDYSELLHEPFVFDYIEQSVQQIASINSENLRTFSLTFQLIALLAENPETFQKLNERNVFDK